MIHISVILPTHRPDFERLQRTLGGLKAQTLPATDWELVLVDNASPTPVTLSADLWTSPVAAHVVSESRLGLTHARRRGFAEARGEFCVLVDDDNILAPDYLTNVIRRFNAHPAVGAMGGPSRPEFATPPPAWAAEFFPLLALRDLGESPQIEGLARHADGHWIYPSCAPIGAGLAIRTTLARQWMAARENTAIADRTGTALTSGGDNDIVLHLLHAGHACAYFPELALTHLIPASRLDAAYLARLNRGIQRSWMQVLSLHGANPWPPLTPWGARLRQLRAWFTYRGWQHPVGHIRWAGASGHFAGRISTTHTR